MSAITSTISSGSASVPGWSGLETLTSDSSTLLVKGNYSGNLWMTSSGTGSLTRGSTRVFDDDSIVKIDASAKSSSMVIAGNSNSVSIKGGSGENTIWGGGYGNDTLTGGSSRDQFWYDGKGNDVVSNFSSGNSSTSDVVVLSEGRLSSVTRSGSVVSVNMANGNSMKLNTTSSSADGIILYSTNGANIRSAKIGGSTYSTLSGTVVDSVTYDSSVNYFKTESGGTLYVTGSSDNNVRLDGSTGQYYAGIKNITSSSTGNNILYGNSQSNVISANGNSSSTLPASAYGTSTIWGGSGSTADTLIGGNGTDIFRFGKSDGNDVIQNASSSDTVNFYDANLSDIVSYNVDSSGNIKAGFNTGGSVSVESNYDDGSLSAKFQFANGSKFAFNKNSRTWQVAS